MKYSTWRVSTPDRKHVQLLVSAGIPPLVAAVMVSRGVDTKEKADAFLAAGHAQLRGTERMPDMEPAVKRIRKAIQNKEKIAVYGDYDVDGVTATCLMTDFLRKQGADCVWYIPGRLDEGYGLNPDAVRHLKSQDVALIITVDCGITAIEEGKLCRELGIDLIITDHHECKEELPEAVAVVNPHRADSEYGFDGLAGVGVAFKVAAAVDGDQSKVFQEYCDLLSMGTVADVMPLVDENRVMVTEGIEKIQKNPRIGVKALIEECGIVRQSINSTTIGYTLSPRINAAGRMGQVEIAENLFLTDDPEVAAGLAEELCILNRERQEIEAQIFDSAVAKLSGEKDLKAIVLADDNWHQGVVGIVASRLAEQYGCPVFLICINGETGKGSSRSYGGFPLFSTLKELEWLLESYGGHELAAGFNIRTDQIDAFREAVCMIAGEYRERHVDGDALEMDCAAALQLLTVPNVMALDLLEPFGSNCPRPLLYLPDMRVRQLTTVGGGRHLKMTLERDGCCLGAIFFAVTAKQAQITEGDLIDVAYTPQVNEFRGNRSVQLNLTDLRPAVSLQYMIEEERKIYVRFRENRITAEEAAELIPPRTEFAAVWRFLTANSTSGRLQEEFTLLSRNIAKTAGIPCSFARMKVCLDVLEERGLIQMKERPGQMEIQIMPVAHKVVLQESEVLIRLERVKGGN